MRKSMMRLVCGQRPDGNGDGNDGRQPLPQAHFGTVHALAAARDLAVCYT